MINPNSLVLGIAEMSYRCIAASRYGGNVLEYLDDASIEKFDLYVEEEAITFLPALLNSLRRMPENIYANVKETTIIKVIFSGKNTAKVYPAELMQNTDKNKAIISLCHWNYNLYKKMLSMYSKYIPMMTMVDYSLYKNVVLK